VILQLISCLLLFKQLAAYASVLVMFSTVL